MTTDQPAVDHHQVPRRQDLDLRERVTLPNGLELGGTRARVYCLLLETARRGLRWPIGRHTGPPGAVPTHVLSEAWAGGTEGTKRVRELRGRYGVRMAEPERYVTPDGQSTSTYLYRLASVADPCKPAPGPGAAARATKPARPTAPPREETADGTAPPPSAAPPAAHPPPLGALRAWLVVGAPGSLVRDVDASAVWEVTPGSVAMLAPSLIAAQRVERGEITTEEADELYRQRLLSLYHRGDLIGTLAPHRRVIFWTQPGPYNPLPMLGRALGAPTLGATIYTEETV